MAELAPAERMFDILLRLPEDLRFDILLRLPVTSLRRCRCVSRGWRDVIDRRDFAKSHLNNLSNSRPPSLLLRREEELTDESIENSYSILNLSSICNSGSPPPAYKELPLPRQDVIPFYIPFYVGHCNGLFCISGSTSALLWNPATGKQFQFGLPEQGRDDWIWGFGYDDDSDDFKVVAMPQTAEGGCMVWIYSRSSRMWKRVGDFFPYLFVGMARNGVFFSGALHWIVHQLGSYVYSIGALHLGKLEYSLVSIPDYNSEPTGRYLNNLGVLDGHLCLIYASTDYSKLELWTLKEYGVEESWTKLSINCYVRHLRPLAYVQNEDDEEVLLFNEGVTKIVGYEIKTRSFRNLFEECWKINIYVPSLFTP